MIGKPNWNSATENGNGTSAPLSHGYGDALDRDRAASMADEGGAAGATRDTREQSANGAAARVRARERQLGWRSQPLLYALAFTLGALAGRLVQRSGSTRAFARQKRTLRRIAMQSLPYARAQRH